MTESHAINCPVVSDTQSEKGMCQENTVSMYHFSEKTMHMAALESSDLLES